MLHTWYRIQKKVKGELSGIYRAILHNFFLDQDHPGANFSSGIKCVIGKFTKTKRQFRVRAKLGKCVQDEKAHKDTVNVKGASGIKLCLKCDNMTKGVEGLGPNDYHKDYRFALPASFVPRTAQRYRVIVKILEDLHNSGSGELEAYEKNLGVVHM